MCTTLSCRKSDKTTECEQIAGIGAAEGTTCGSGMVNSNLQETFIQVKLPIFSFKIFIDVCSGFLCVQYPRAEI